MGKIKKLLLGFFICLLILASANNAQASIFIVDPNYNCFSDLAYAEINYGYTPYLLDTGIDFNAGDILESHATGLWWHNNTVTNIPWYDANGTGGLSGAFPQVRQGSLLGQISNNGPHIIHNGNSSGANFFMIGANYSGPVDRSGRLYLGFADTDYGNNQGYVTVDIQGGSLVPEPSSMLLLGLGSLAFSLFKRKR